ncbi:MAG: alpha/beta hydrolase [Candidatus Methylacidiphilales bacterium]|nr:alpha/beta fold hydrolase [Candidatus Methylacidiphilales bacterium]
MTSEPRQSWSARIWLKLRNTIYIALRVYLLLLVMLYFFVDYLLYRPPTYSEQEARSLASQLGLETYSSAGQPEVPTAQMAKGQGQIQGQAGQAAPVSAISWENVAYTTIAEPRLPLRGTIIMAHGNAGSAIYSAAFSDALTPLGFRVILYEYPGYGSNPGRASEPTCVEPLRRLVRDVAARNRRNPPSGSDKIYLFGQSMGCGIVCSALSDNTLPVAGVILMQPWDSLGGVGSYHFPFVPARLLVGAKYDSMANLTHFTGPVAFVVCQNDRTIPPRLSKRLYDSYPGRKTWLELPNSDHNDWPADPDQLWWKTITDFIAP